MDYIFANVVCSWNKIKEGIYKIQQDKTEFVIVRFMRNSNACISQCGETVILMYIVDKE